jgi:lysophospholipase
LSANPLVGHADDFAPWIDDLRAFVAQWKQSSPAPHVIVAHSMGGHLVLRALAEHALTVDAAALIAPMLGFRAPYPDRIGLAVATLMTRIGNPARAAWKASEKPGASMKLRQTLLTHDAARYADETWWHDHLPGTVLGPPSWRWVQRAYASFLALAKPGLLETVATPLLILSTSVDALVDPGAIRRDVARLPAATFHQYGSEAAHELLREVDGVRDDVLRRIAAFFDQTVPVQ